TDMPAALSTHKATVGVEDFKQYEKFIKDYG
ncbi:unnamed protein product, partial [Didymodactylos carnosus]